MALVRCPECDRDVSDQALACPHCGVPIRLALKNGHSARKPATHITYKQTIFWSAVVVGCVWGLAKLADDSKDGGVSSITARTLCEDALKAASRDPERAQIPYVQGIDKGDEIQFVWDEATKLLRLRNGLGLEVGVSGSCSINKKSARITSLLIDGALPR